MAHAKKALGKLNNNTTVTKRGWSKGTIFSGETLKDSFEILLLKGHCKYIRLYLVIIKTAHVLRDNGNLTKAAFFTFGQSQIDVS